MSGCGQVMKEVLEPTLKSSLPCTERKEKQRKFKSGMQLDNWTSLRYYVCGLFILYNTSLPLSICTSYWYPYGRSSNNITCCTMPCLLHT